MKISFNPSIISRNWNRYWYSFEDPFNLAFLRILYFGLFWFIFYKQVQIAWAEIPLEFWQPISFFKNFHLIPPNTTSLKALILLWNFSLFLSFIGLVTPISVFLCSTTSLYLFGLRYCYGFMHPTDSSLIFICFLFIFSSSGYQWSVDEWISQRYSLWSIFRGNPPRAWLIKLIWLSWSMMFFSAGLAKLRHAGLEWITTDNLRNYIIHNQYWFHFRIFSNSFNPALILIQHPLICQIAAAAALGLELLVPLILFSQKARKILVPLFLVFQIANGTILLVDFYQSFLVYIFFINWSFILKKIGLLKSI